MYSIFSLPAAPERVGMENSQNLNMEEIMKSLRYLLLALFTITLIGGCAVKKSQKEMPLPLGTLTASEVNVLFTGYTVESVLNSSGRKSLTYYNPNLEMIQLQNGAKRSGYWRVREDGRICLKFGTEDEKCRIIVKEGETYYKYIVKKSGNHERVLSYTSFRKGNLID